jgi:hypothetical protein
MRFARPAAVSIIVALACSIWALADSPRADSSHLLQARTTIRLKFLRGPGEAVAGMRFDAVIGYWSGSQPDLVQHLHLGPGECTAAIVRPWNGRRQGTLGTGESAVSSSIFVRETAAGPRLPALVWSWQVPFEAGGRSTVDKALVVRCARYVVALSTSGQLVSVRHLRRDYVRWFHIFRTAP